MGYAMSSKSLQGAINHDLFYHTDEAYSMTFLSTDSNQENHLFVKKIDWTDIHALRYFVIGKKAADAGADNVLNLKIDSYSCGDTTFPDVNETIGGGWHDVSAYNGDRLLRVYTAGGTDAQYYKILHVWAVMDKNL